MPYLDRCLPVRVVVVMVHSDHRPRRVVTRRRFAGRRRWPVPLAEGLYTHPDAPTQPGQHQQQAETDEAHADDFCRGPDAGGEGDGDRHGANEEKAGADGDDDQRTTVVG